MRTEDKTLMSRTGPRTPTIETRILAALRIAARHGLGGLTVAELRARPGLCSRRSPEIAAAAERLVDRGDVVPGWRRVRYVGARWTYRLTNFRPASLGVSTPEVRGGKWCGNK